jgi:hypothetical protein
MQMKTRFKALIPHLIVTGIFLLLITIYFSPVFSGKKLAQSDLMQVAGMGQEVFEYKKQTGETSLWTNSMFGGMPAYQISGIESSFNLFSIISKVISFGLPQPLPLVILYFVGAYIFLLAFGAGPWIGGIGAMAFTFCSYNFIILEAGHYNKSLAIAFMGPVLAGIRYTYRKDLLIGGILSAFFVALQVWGGHPQITYYLLFAILCYVLAEGWSAFQEKTLPHFLKASGILILAAGLGTASYAGHLYITYDYAKQTIRGNSELSSSGNETGSGLDKDYAFAWSYGKAETFTLLIPRFMGGSSQEDAGKNSEAYKVLVQNGYSNAEAKRLPTYWGAQPFTSGPVYVGAVMIFLFVLGCFLIKGPTRYWILAATLLSFMLAWGKNLEWFNYLLFDTLPMFNKFRAVAMALVIASLTIPLMAALALSAWVSSTGNKQEKLKALYWATGITGGLCLLFALAPGTFFDFSGPSDNQMGQLAKYLVSDRKSMMQQDAGRSLGFILATAIIAWLLLNQKLKKEIFLGIVAALTLTDLWTVNLRYLGKDEFKPATQVEKPFAPSIADQMILEDKDPNFRVLNTTVNTFNDASTSYFHKSVGGYHPAKLRRYQDMIERHISQNHFNVLNMLNTKYLIMSSREEGGSPMAQRNPGALGNAWFVHNLIWAENADQEIEALNPPFAPDTTAVADVRFKSQILTNWSAPEPGDTIFLTSYKPNELIYTSRAKGERLAVFSEVYFPNGWKVWIDDQPADHFRVNYILRSMNVPAGEHSIRFKFDPDDYTRGNALGDITSGIITVLLILAVFMTVKKSVSKDA